MKSVLDIQRRGQQIGRLRIGQQVKASNGKMRPAKLDTFRFTTASRSSAEAVAALYGGQIRDWQDQFEVITSKSEIGVSVPPRDRIVSQAYEMWTAGGCQRRCDSQRQQNGEPCACPHAADQDDEDEVARCAAERAALAKMNPPQACKLVTRISVMIPDLPGLGVWRLDTGSYYAGVEIGDAAALMELARGKGIFLPAILRIEQRSRVANGQTKKYPVPVLEVLATFRQIASGELESQGITAGLPPAPGGQPRAITAGAPAKPPARGPVLADDPDAEQHQEAQRVFDQAVQVSDAGQFRALAKSAEDKGLSDLFVCDDRETDHWQQLHDALAGLWREKAKAGAA